LCAGAHDIDCPLISTHGINIAGGDNDATDVNDIPDDDNSNVTNDVGDSADVHMLNDSPAIFLILGKDNLVRVTGIVAADPGFALSLNATKVVNATIKDPNKNDADGNDTRLVILGRNLFFSPSRKDVQCQGLRSLSFIKGSNVMESLDNGCIVSATNNTPVPVGDGEVSVVSNDINDDNDADIASDVIVTTGDVGFPSEGSFDVNIAFATKGGFVVNVAFTTKGGGDANVPLATGDSVDANDNVDVTNEVGDVVDA